MNGGNENAGIRLHRNTVEAVLYALKQIFEENRHADKVIEKVLKSNPRWGARDRAFIAETTYDIVRWWRVYREAAGLVEVKNDDYWLIIAVWCVLHNVTLPPWKEFEAVSEEEIIHRDREISAIRKIRESVPDWLDALGEHELGATWDKELHALNEEAKVVLRTNTLKTTRNELQQKLAEAGVDTLVSEKFPDALILKNRMNVFQLPLFREGLFEVQDAASQLVAPFLKPKPGMRVIDACAGAGGKTLHLAALMQNKGKIIALDTEQWKLDELKKRARRAGVSNTEIRWIDSEKVVKRLQGSADRLLLDVPCSGLGVLRRNPDAKWKLSSEFIEKVKNAQEKILQEYASLLKPGGVLVYATCSILPSENEVQVKKFIAHNAGFQLIEEKRVWPSEGFDGFYMAALTRTA